MTVTTEVSASTPTVWHLLPDRCSQTLTAKALSPLTVRDYLSTARRSNRTAVDLDRAVTVACRRRGARYPDVAGLGGVANRAAVLTAVCWHLTNALCAA